MKIATFGSCLSRLTANQYMYLFGGKIISSVYHNRSDVFVKRYIDNNAPQLKHHEIIDKLIEHPEEKSIDNQAKTILANQYIQTLGRHRLRRGIPFLDVIENQMADLIIFDNYMDLSARLLTVRGTDPEAKWFLRPRDLKDPKLAHVGDLLSPRDGAENILRIIQFVRKKSPDSKLIFLNFPYATYAPDQDRVQRTQAYQEIIFSKAKGFSVVPCLDIPEHYRTKEKQHFAKEMYCGYAGIIKSEDALISPKQKKLVLGRLLPH